ncbi:LytR/AlgR family response regulator transcription factor [Aquiflexum sp.]|uniref:LytR/AlgR family response regulator transcription factor n=1 Tax=Aquiflexum sp. TaxID=1872584 RepID=UPI003592EC2A
MHLRIGIIDDEPSARDIIRKLLKKSFPDAAVIGEADSVAEGVLMLQREQPDILFLDVEMEDGTGFDLLDKIQPVHFNVIFCTAFDAFAIKAFKYNALDYLLKPVHPDELVAAVQKAQHNTNQQFIQSQIDNLINATAAKSLQRIALSMGDGLVYIQLKEIMRIQSVGNFTHVFLIDRKRILASHNLRFFEDILPNPDFLRPHQSHILNTMYLRKFSKDDGGFALMTNGDKVPVSRRNKDKFLEALGR